ncbi:MAG TPA: hypothetical protein VI911_08630 [Patescibacteria group bacterium]|nr:MAG: hypothetical protein UR43_C0005G0107 [candidate division TM6 bacterium GW2011_GWF2_33_332]HLD91061.1 hypothetical protein [Patescibacteria group bacterium]
MKVTLKDRFGFTKIYKDKYIKHVIKKGNLLTYEIRYPYIDKDSILESNEVFIRPYSILESNENYKVLIFVWDRISNLEDKKITFIEKDLL